MKISRSVKIVSAVAIVVVIVAVVAGIALADRTGDKAPAKAKPLPAPVAVQTAPAPVPPIDPTQVPIIVYHTVAPKSLKPESAMQKHYHVTPESFEAQMKYLSDNGYHPIQFQQYANYLLGNGTLPDKPVVITFDDGWKTQYAYAEPILEKYKFTATFFIITKTIGGSYMTWDDIKNLDAQGFEIASHSETHPDLTKIPPDQLHDEIFGSKQILETELGHPITTFAYPYYMTNADVESVIASAGYVAARAGWERAPDSVTTVDQLTSQEAVNNDNPFSSKVAQ